MQQPQLSPAEAATEDKKLPKEYTELVKRIVSSLRESLQAEASGASEREVRRKAEPAKEAVMDYVGKWQANPKVSDDPSSEEIKKALAELGAFYKAKGSRSRLTDEVRGTVLGHLAAAEAALRQDLYRGSQKLMPSQGGSEGLLELI